MPGPERNQLSYNKIFRLYGMNFGYMEWISRSLRPVYEAVEAVEASAEAVDAIGGLADAVGGLADTVGGLVDAIEAAGGINRAVVGP